jgi:type I restriction enzyme S subunit
LLIVEGNGSLDHIGRVALWNDEIPNARHQNHIIRVRPHSISSRFVLEWLASPLGREAIVEEATSAAGLYTLSLSKVSRLPIPIPPRGEQQRIIAKLEMLQARSQSVRQALDAMTHQLSVLDRSILWKAFRGELVQQDPNEPVAEVLARQQATGSGPDDSSEVGSVGTKKRKSRRDSARGHDVRES